MTLLSAPVEASLPWWGGGRAGGTLPPCFDAPERFSGSHVSTGHSQFSHTGWEKYLPPFRWCQRICHFQKKYRKIYKNHKNYECGCMVHSDKQRSTVLASGGGPCGGGITLVVARADDHHVIKRAGQESTM